MRLLTKRGFVIIVDNNSLVDKDGNIITFNTKEEAEKYISENNINGYIK